MVVFFIFMVANAGGSLTPLGDPPLFLGFLHGVPFFWTLRVFPIFLTVIAFLAILYYLFDSYYLRKEQREQAAAGIPEQAAGQETSGKALEILGFNNILLLLCVIGTILFSGSVEMGEVNVLGISMGIQDLIQNVVLLIISVVSWFTTSKALRGENEYSWAPIQEVAYLFFGIFITMAPTLAILKAGEAGALGFITAAVTEPAHYFWASGALSSFLDNAPTYLTFLNTALGQFYPGVAEPQAVAALLAEHPAYLLGISAGAVFFGANTYIGNAPNFMVRSIAEEAGVPMPSFFGYMKYSICILLPIFVLVTFIFF
jgi:Na+/H+ antiporter NhaD/arsenite permease-like protein